jgi:hypothetical protein
MDFHGADLRGADFTGATLVGANFTDANLAGAHFGWTNVSHADFTGALGVVGSQFPRADLTGARLPAGVHFSAFDTASEAAAATGKLFLTVLAVCTYSLLTVGSTVDAKLLTDTAVSKLPVLNAEIPIVSFYALVPIALVGLALVAMLQAQSLWTAVAAAPAVLPDGTAMADRASTWLVGAWAVDRLTPPGERRLLAYWQARFVVLVGWCLVPATIVWFWLRYLHRHDWSVTLLQVVALAVASGAALAFLTLRPHAATRPRPRAPH